MASSSNIRHYERIVSKNADLEKVQDSLERAFRSVEACPIIDGALLTGVVLKEGDNTIRHPLGRALRGWVVTGLAGATSIYDKQRVNDSKDKTLILNSSTAGTIDAEIWVF